MLHRVERRELTCAHVLAHPLATYHNLPCFYYSFSSIHGISITPPNSHQCPASPLTSTPSPMPSSKAAESCFLLQHNHNRATSDTANTCQTQDFHSYTSSYLCSARTLQAAVQGMESTYSPSAPSAVYRLYRERKASSSCLSWHLLGCFLVAIAGCFQVLCWNLLKVNNVMVY